MNAFLFFSRIFACVSVVYHFLYELYVVIFQLYAFDYNFYRLQKFPDSLEEAEKNGVSTLPTHIKGRLSKYEGLSDNMTALPTMWMGSQND